MHGPTSKINARMTGPLRIRICPYLSVSARDAPPIFPFPVERIRSGCLHAGFCLRTGVCLCMVGRADDHVLVWIGGSSVDCACGTCAGYSSARLGDRKRAVRIPNRSQQKRRIVFPACHSGLSQRPVTAACHSGLSTAAWNGEGRVFRLFTLPPEAVSEAIAVSETIERSVLFQYADMQIVHAAAFVSF